MVIRSRNRIERLQDVPRRSPWSPAASSDRTGADDIKAITQRLGNVSWNQGNQRTSSLSIRGIGKQGQTEAQDPSVGVIVDGVNYAYNALPPASTTTTWKPWKSPAAPRHPAGQEHQPGRGQHHHPQALLHPQCLLP